MPISIAAKRYAQALIATAQNQNLVERVGNDLDFLSALYSANRNFSRLITHPLIPPQEKFYLLENRLQDKIHPLTIRFMELLIRKQRSSYLPEINESYQMLKDSLNGIVRVQVTTTFPLGEETRSRLKETLDRLTGKNTILDVTADRSLLGGLTVQMGDRLFDGSVRRRLRTLREHLLSSVRLDTAYVRTSN